MMKPLTITSSLSIPASDLSWTAARSSGPGGQNVNKVSTKVELRFDLAGTQALGPTQKARLRVIAGRRLDADGCIRIVSQRTRDQVRNLDDTLDKLADIVREALPPPKTRRPTKPSRGAKRRRMDDKRLVGQKKRLRGLVSSED
jgi:ribosome-associated protein